MILNKKKKNNNNNNNQGVFLELLVAAKNLTHHQGRVSVNMLGWMWGYGVGEFTKIENRFTGKFWAFAIQI